MAEKLVLRDVSIRVDGTQLQTRCRRVTVNETADELAADAFGGNGYKEYEPGLIDATITAEFYKSFDTGGDHDVLYPLWTSKEEFEVRIGAEGDSGAVDTPVYVAPVKIYNYSFLDGEVGQLAINPVVFRLTGPPSLDIT